MVEQPIEIASITPYGERQPRVRLSLPEILVGLGWLTAAVLAVAASFARVYSLTASLPGTDGEIASLVRYAVDGWGRPSIVHTGPGSFGSSGASGPRYGILFCITASILPLGWLQSLRVTRSRWEPPARAVSGADCPFLMGVVACQVVATAPNRTGLPAIHESFHFGPSPWLAGSACLLGSLIWTAQRRIERATRPRRK